MSSVPPPFLTDYPTGTLNNMGKHLRATSCDASNYLPPLRPHDQIDLPAIVIPTHRRVSHIRQTLARTMHLAQEHGMYIVVLCSGQSRQQDIVRLANRYPKLHWVVIEGPFTHAGHGLQFASDTPPLAYPLERDQSVKRNLGLLLARAMGWRAVMLLDDDISLSKNHLLKVSDLARNGASLVACNVRDYPDNSVVVGAYREAYGSNKIDSFLGSSLLVVGLQNGVLSFFPHIYNEDWLFMVPYILWCRDTTWAGSVKQSKYDPFIKNRAKNEEVGDLIAEGLLRLTIALVKENHSESYEDLLHTLVTRADKTFWEREILQRAAFIRELLHGSNYPVPRSKVRRIKSALLASLHSLIGDGIQDGIDAEAIVSWVQCWAEDLKKWRALPLTTPGVGQVSISAALKSIGVEGRSIYKDSLARDTANVTSSAQGNSTKNDHALTLLPVATRTTMQKIGILTTSHLAAYLHKRRLSIHALVAVSARLRYDRPVRSLTGNKPILTIVIAIRAHEDIGAIASSIKDIAAWNIKQLPIHCIVWIAPTSKHHRRKLDTYREYLIARLMLETAGTNIRFLSCIGSVTVDKTFTHIVDEIVSVVAPTYWKHAIHSIGHQVCIVNSKNEFLLQGELVDFMSGNYTVPSESLSQTLRNITSPSVKNTLHASQELRATEFVRHRLLGQTIHPKKRLRTYLARATSRLINSMDRAKISWVELDDLNYATQVHDSHQVDIIARTSRVVAIPLLYSTELRYAKSALERTIQTLLASPQTGAYVTEVMIIVWGYASPKKLQAYRANVIADLQSYIEVPIGIFLTSTIMRTTANDTISFVLKRSEALVRYEHWLENHNIAPNITWVTAGPKGKPFALSKLWMVRVMQRLTAHWQSA